MRFFLLTPLLLLLIVPLQGGRRHPIDVLKDHADALAESYNSWAHYAGDLSPYSPDYAAQVREKWLQEDIGGKFRALERRLEDLE